MSDRVAGTAAGGENPEIGLDLVRLVDKFATRHARHNYVVEQEVDPPILALEETKRCGAIIRFEHPITQFEDDFDGKVPHVIVVLNGQNRERGSRVLRLSAVLGLPARFVAPHQTP